LTGDKSGLETTLEAKQREAKSAREETIAVKKQNLIQDAAAKLGFFNPQQVAKLTGESVSWDGKQFVVLSEKDGTPRVGLDGNSPLSVDEFFREFATQNPHLVRGSVLPGIGSREATQPSHKTLGERERLAQYFGKGSSSQKANALAIESPNLYRQYKREARALGIIP